MCLLFLLLLLLLIWLLLWRAPNSIRPGLLWSVRDVNAGCRHDLIHATLKWSRVTGTLLHHLSTTADPVFEFLDCTPDPGLSAFPKSKSVCWKDGSSVVEGYFSKSHGPILNLCGSVFPWIYLPYGKEGSLGLFASYLLHGSFATSISEGWFWCFEIIGGGLWWSH